MPASVRPVSIVRPARRLWKPRGSPRIIRSLAPRGLEICAAISPEWQDLVRGRKPIINGSPTIGNTPRGRALLTDGGTQNVAYQIGAANAPGSATGPVGFSFEVLFWNSAVTTSGSICGFDTSSAGNAGVGSYAGLGSQYPSGWGFQQYDSSIGNRIVGGSSDNVAGKWYHLIGTYDGNTMSFYTNGVLSQATAIGANYASNHSVSDLYFCVGIGASFFGTNWASGAILLCNYATVGWTAAEVMERYLNPLGFLQWPEDRYYYLPGLAAAANYFPYIPRRPLLRRRGGTPRVNWRDPLTAKLIAVVRAADFVYDPVSRSRLSVGSAGGYVTTLAGPAVQGTANNQGASVTAPASLKVTGDVSLFWLGEIKGLPSGISDFIGITYDSAGAAPFCGYLIDGQNGSSDLSLVYNTAGTFGAISWTGANPGSGVTDFLVVANSGARLYVNGVDKGSGSVTSGLSYNGTQTYSSTALFDFGVYQPAAGSRFPNANSVLGFIWNRALTAAEAQLLHADPTRFLLFPEDRRYYLGTAPLLPSTAPRGWFDPGLISPRAWF